MTEPKSIPYLLQMQWQKVRGLLTHNWKPKYLCLSAAVVVWGAVFFATERDSPSMSSWDALEEIPKDPNIGGNNQNQTTHPHPTEAKPVKGETK